MDLRVRPAGYDDCILLNLWLGSTPGRKVKLKPGRVPPEVFKRWFFVLAADKDILSLVAELLMDDQWVQVGRVRIRTTGEISISIDENYRGKRLAIPIIRASLRYAKLNCSIKEVFARIRSDNTPSIKAFRGAGFRLKGKIDTGNCLCIVYTYDFIKCVS